MPVKKKRAFSFLITDNTKLLYYPPSLDHTSISNVIISVGKSNYICISYEHVKTKPPQLNIVKGESALGETTYKAMSWSHWLLLLEKLTSAICSQLCTPHHTLLSLVPPRPGFFQLGKTGENWKTQQTKWKGKDPPTESYLASFTHGMRGQDFIIQRKPGNVKATSPLAKLEP